MTETGTSEEQQNPVTSLQFLTSSILMQDVEGTQILGDVLQLNL
jgi:hypothetical protein